MYPKYFENTYTTIAAAKIIIHILVLVIFFCSSTHRLCNVHEPAWRLLFTPTLYGVTGWLNSRASASRSNGFLDPRFEPRQEHKNKFVNFSESTVLY